MSRRGVAAVLGAGLATVAVTWGVSTCGPASLGGAPGSSGQTGAGAGTGTSTASSTGTTTTTRTAIAQAFSPGPTSTAGFTTPFTAQFAATATAAAPTVGARSAPPAAPKVAFHSPAPGEHWRSGGTLALPCRTTTDTTTDTTTGTTTGTTTDTPAGTPADTTLLHAGAVSTALRGYRQPVLRLRDGGRLDLADGRLGFVGWEYLPDGAGAARLHDVPPGTWAVTLAELWDRTWDPARHAPWLAAAEVRLGTGVPTRWVDDGTAVTDAATLAWFGPAALERVLATGYDPLNQLDDQGLTAIDVTSAWDAPCTTLDVAPREVSQPHDVLVMDTGADGWYGQYLGLDARGRTVTVVIATQAVPWAVLGLPGTPPAGLDR